MRVILFRGKTIDGDWTYGYYVFTPKRTGAFGQTISSVDFDRHYILTMKFNIVKEVIPETVGQYTGLEDSNGKKIFEGDIVKEGCNGLIGVVVWCNSLGTYRLANFGEDYAIKEAPFEWEIISNIHDNPELLETQ